MPFDTIGLDKQYSVYPTQGNEQNSGVSDAGIQSGWSKSLGGGRTQQYGMEGQNLGISQDKDQMDYVKNLAVMAAMAYGMGGLAGMGGAGAAAGAGGSAGGMGSIADLLGSSGMGGLDIGGLSLGGTGVGSMVNAAGDIGMMADVGMGAGGASGGVGNWLSQAYQSLLGPGSTLGGKGGLGGGGSGWLGPLLSVGSGLFGMSQAAGMKDLANKAIAGSAPWTASGGTAMAGDALKTVISGDLANDPGAHFAELSAARSSAQQPGGFAAQAAANAAMKYQNDRIQALGSAAGVGFNPAAGYQTAMAGYGQASDTFSKSLGSIGFGLTGNNSLTSMPPWLQQFMLKNGMGG